MEIRKMYPDIETGYEDGRLVMVKISGDLGYSELMHAAKQIQEFARREYGSASLKPDFESVAGEIAEEVTIGIGLRRGTVSDEYLARLAVAYEELALQGRDVSARLAAELGRPLSTVKRHIKLARDKGFLTSAVVGREGGEATSKARKLAGGSRK
ncbi:hypothetical protein [Mycolicibacterium fortuitum]|uniref:hypothetical protein n=1 Tax=Mycolicibacterium fortuitum TaxID=1766 RepID=UPI003AADBE3E